MVVVDGDDVGGAGGGNGDNDICWVVVVVK